jgi:hypothetical protein
MIDDLNSGSFVRRLPIGSEVLSPVDLWLILAHPEESTAPNKEPQEWHSQEMAAVDTPFCNGLSLFLPNRKDLGNEKDDEDHYCTDDRSSRI